MSERADRASPQPEHNIPTSCLLEYLAATGLGTRLALLIEGRRYQNPDLEQLWSSAIEVEQLFLQTELPERTERELLELVDRANEGGRELLLVPLPSPRSAGRSRLDPLQARRYELLSLGPHAQAVRSVRVAWARIWGEVAAWCSDASTAPSLPSRAELERFEPKLVSTTTAAASVADAAVADEYSGPAVAATDGEPSEVTVDLRYAELPGSAPVPLAAETLEPLVHRLEQIRSLADPGAGDGVTARAPMLVRYALGLRYNRVIAPADPFEFLGVIASVHAEAERLSEAYLAGVEAAGDHDGRRLLALARRAYAVERRISRSVRWTGTAPSEAPPRTTARAARRPLLAAQQLVGIATAPGRVRGVVVRVAANGAGGEGPPADAGVVAAQGGPAAMAREGVVVACERLTVPVFQAALASTAAGSGGVVAFVEHAGTPLGLGALLARERGLPCVSSVGDLEFIEDGTPVAVDGEMGLVTVVTGPR